MVYGFVDEALDGEILMSLIVAVVKVREEIEGHSLADAGDY